MGAFSKATTALLVTLLLMPLLSAISGPFYYLNRTYYTVFGNYTPMNTGAKVCALAGLQCVGYTGYTTNICQQVHPGANVVTSVNGSKAGYYCNGPQQQGECSFRYNTCDICPACNINADCNSTIGTLFNQMFVQCAVNATAAAKNITTSISVTGVRPSYGTSFSLFGSIGSFFAGFFNFFASFFANLFHANVPSPSSVSYQTVQIGPYPGYWGCELFQTPWPGVNQKKVTCSAYKAGDNFCAIALNSQYARAQICNDTTGLIFCTNPCNTGGQLLPSSCPYDAARQRGSQAAPLNWCNQASTGGSSGGTGSGSGASAGGTICPYGCYLYQAGTGGGGSTSINCNVNSSQVHQPLGVCQGLTTNIGSGSNSCTCPPVQTVAQACPSSCNTTQTACQASLTIGQSGVPCEGQFQGTNEHCACIYKNGQWAVGSQYGVR